jgi:tRNA(Ile)-lysidine synthase
MDPTNEHESFLRNRIRKHVIPGLEHSDKRFNANFLRTLESLQKTEKFLANLTAKTFNEINIVGHHKNTLDRAKLIALEPLLLDRVIMHWLIAVKVPFVPSEHFLAEIKRFLQNSAPGIHQIHSQWSIHKSPTGVWIEF